MRRRGGLTYNESALACYSDADVSKTIDDGRERPTGRHHTEFGDSVLGILLTGLSPVLDVCSASISALFNAEASKESLPIMVPE